MTDIDKILHDLSDVARTEVLQSVDVRARVMTTISSKPKSVPLDVLPIVVTAVAVAIAATAVFLLLPVWQTMFEPWASYFPN